MNLVQIISIVFSVISVIGIILILCIPVVCDVLGPDHDNKKYGDAIRFLFLVIIISIFAFLTTLTP